jgi:hypothetical protein
MPSIPNQDVSPVLLADSAVETFLREAAIRALILSPMLVNMPMRKTDTMTRTIPVPNQLKYHGSITDR